MRILRSIIFWSGFAMFWSSSQTLIFTYEKTPEYNQTLLAMTMIGFFMAFLSVTRR